uniref:Ig-like domain-containing protein n=1 Tax=Callorhinchus milii TaxID=7868 RepID=A0A4W3GAK7_CALMI
MASFCFARFSCTMILVNYNFNTAGSSQTVSQSPPEQAAFTGERINLHCQYSGFCGQDFSVSWYRQSPGEELKYLLHRKPSGEGGNPTGGHISASLDTAKKISVLTIADLRLSDSAMYHCALSLHHSDTHHRKPRTITLITAKSLYVCRYRV